MTVRTTVGDTTRHQDRLAAHPQTRDKPERSHGRRPLAVSQSLALTHELVAGSASEWQSEGLNDWPGRTAGCELKSFANNLDQGRAMMGVASLPYWSNGYQRNRSPSSSCLR